MVRTQSVFAWFGLLLLGLGLFASTPFIPKVKAQGDSIVYSGGVITVVGTYTDLFEDIYQADVAGGWGVVGKTGNNAYSVNNTMICIGDGENITDVSDSSCLVNMFGGSDIAFRVMNNASVTFGVLLDATSKSVADGVAFVVESWYYWQFDEGSTVNLYGCSVVSDQNLEIDCYGTGNIYRSTFTSGYYMLCFYNVATYDVYDVYLSNDYSQAIQFADAGLMTVNTIYSSDSPYLYNLYNSINPLTVRNLFGRGATTTTFFVGLLQNVYLINPDVDSWTFTWFPGTTHSLFRQYEFDLIATYPNGTAFSGANVTISNAVEGKIGSWLTFANGSIPTQTLTMGYYDQVHGDVLQNYNPYNLTATGNGYTYYKSWTLHDKADWEIALLPTTDTTEARSMVPYFLLGLVVSFAFIIYRKKHLNQTQKI